MKKMTKRDQLLLLFLTLFVVLAAFFKYVYEPLEGRIKEASEKRDSLQSQVETNKIDVLNTKVKSLDSQLQMEEAEKKDFEKQRMITKAQQEQLLQYIGEQAKKLGINLSKFEEKETKLSSSYNVVGYDIKARGENKNLILFLNSLYSFYNYCYITDLNLRKVEISPTFETTDLKTLTPEEKLNVDWDDDQIKLILMDIPPFIVEKDLEKKAEEKQKKPSRKELQIDFSLYFILSE